MKKITKIILISIFSACLGISLLVLIFSNEQKKETMCPYFELNDVFLEISLVTNNSFLLSNSEMFLYVPVNFSDKNNYIFAYNFQNDEYFILTKDLDEETKNELEVYVNTNNKLYPENKIKFEKIDQYIYIISSNEYDSVIEGIIRSYIFC